MNERLNRSVQLVKTHYPVVRHIAQAANSTAAMTVVTYGGVFQLFPELMSRKQYVHFHRSGGLPNQSYDLSKFSCVPWEQVNDIAELQEHRTFMDEFSSFEQFSDEVGDQGSADVVGRQLRVGPLGVNVDISSLRRYVNSLSFRAWN